MLEVRYNGCSECRKSMRLVLALAGARENRDYTFEFHKEHRGDAIYKKRPDYLKGTSGGILYNPDTQSWIDLYPDGANIIDQTAQNLAVLQKFLQTPR